MQIYEFSCCFGVKQYAESDDVIPLKYRVGNRYSLLSIFLVGIWQQNLAHVPLQKFPAFWSATTDRPTRCPSSRSHHPIATGSSLAAGSWPYQCNISVGGTLTFDLSLPSQFRTWVPVETTAASFWCTHTSTTTFFFVHCFGYFADLSSNRVQEGNPFLVLFLAFPQFHVDPPIT